MKKYDVCGLGNGIIDIIVKIDEASFSELGLQKGFMTLVDTEVQQGLLNKFHNIPLSLCSGGSVANSIIAISQLGGNGALISSLATDRYGQYYIQEMDQLKIKHTTQPIAGGASGTSVILVTPDAERTMQTSLGASALITESSIDPALICDSQWLFIEGYLLANPEYGQPTVRKAVEIAKQSGTKIAQTLSDKFVVDCFRPMVDYVIEQADLVFANQHEAAALAGMDSNTTDLPTLFSKLAGRVKNLIMTAGPDGAYLAFEGQKGHVKAFPCQPVDLTGAGDMFAGAFLYGVTHQVPVLEATQKACYLAKAVITQIGGRLSSDTRVLWDNTP